MLLYRSFLFPKTTFYQNLRGKKIPVFLNLHEKLLSTLSNLPLKVEYRLEAPKFKRLSIQNDIVPNSNFQHLHGLGLCWNQPPRTVLIVKKPQDSVSDKALVEVSDWLHEKYNINIIIEPHIKEEIQKKIPYAIVFSKDQISSLQSVVDFVVTLGGDGSILHVSSLFNAHVPPLISFSMGRLGFLLPFKISHFRKELERLINGSVTLLQRNRLQCRFVLEANKEVKWNGITTDVIQVANEVNVHRGTYPHLTSINCYVDGLFLTNGIADGLIVATPTGSTAYSLSAGGPIVHPSIEGLLLTPICPRSLSFRPVLLPSQSVLTLSLDHYSRSTAQVSLDGREACSLKCDESIQVTKSPYPLLSVNRDSGGKDWTHDINHLLKWNQNFSSHLSNPHED